MSAAQLRSLDDVMANYTGRCNSNQKLSRWLTE